MEVYVLRVIEIEEDAGTSVSIYLFHDKEDARKQMSEVSQQIQDYLAEYNVPLTISNYPDSCEIATTDKQYWGLLLIAKYSVK